MSSILSRFGTKKTSPRRLQVDPDRTIYAGHHATVNCHECNRIMVPRVITYYGQAQKSICPFCGATFMKFPSGLQRFLQRFHSSKLSFQAFSKLAIIAISFGLFGFVSDRLNLPIDFTLSVTFGAIFLATIALAELVFQCVEQLAARLSHQSNYYWATLILIVMLIANAHPEITYFMVIFFFAMVFRSFLVGIVQINKRKAR